MFLPVWGLNSVVCHLIILSYKLNKHFIFWWNAPHTNRRGCAYDWQPMIVINWRIMKKCGLSIEHIFLNNTWIPRIYYIELIWNKIEYEFWIKIILYSNNGKIGVKLIYYKTSTSSVFCFSSIIPNPKGIIFIACKQREFEAKWNGTQLYNSDVEAMFI